MFTERELDELQDQLKGLAIRRAEREETRILSGTKVILFRCTMCTALTKRLVAPGDPEHDMSTEDLMRKHWQLPELHDCTDSWGPHHRKYGVTIPIGVLSPW